MHLHLLWSEKYGRHLRFTAFWFKNAILRVPSKGRKIRKTFVHIDFYHFWLMGKLHS